MYRTKEAVLLIPTAAMLIAVLACNVPTPAGSETPVATGTGVETPVATSSGVETPVATEPTAGAPTSVPEPADTPVPGTACPTATEGTTLYVNEENGFCLLYPSYFEVQPTYTDRPDEVFALIGPLLDPDAMETIAVVLTVSYNGAADGLDSAGYADKWQELYLAGIDPTALNVTREDVAISGLPAVVLRNLPGYGNQRGAFLVANGIKYQIALQPQPEDVPALAEHTNLVWETVTSSIVFFPPQNDRPVVRAEDVCPPETADTRLYTRLVDGYCFLYPADFEPDPAFPGAVTGGPVVGTDPDFGNVRTSLTLGTFGSFPGQTPRDVLAPRLDLIDAASVQDVTIGGYPAVIFRDPRGPWASRQAMIMVGDFAYTIVAQPWEPERWPDGIPYLDRVWDTVTGSLAFFNKWR
jgi:hypothetical protein